MLTAFICFMAFVDCTILNPMGASGLLRMVSIFRIAGVSRLYRSVQKYRQFGALRTLLQTLKNCLPTLLWTLVLLILVIYAFSVITTQQIGHNVSAYHNYRKQSGGWDHEELFGTIGRSMFSLLQIMTLDSWCSKYMRHIAGNQAYMIPFFAIFLLLAPLGILNILVSVIVEQTIAASDQNKQRLDSEDEKLHLAELDSLKNIFIISDRDGSNTLDLEEFRLAMNNSEVQWQMDMLDLPIEQTEKLFGVVDGDGSQCLSFDDFIHGCMKLKGHAQSKDMLAVMAQADALARKMDRMADALAESERMLAKLDEISLQVSRRFDSALLGSRRRIARSVAGSKPMIPPKWVGPQGDNIKLSFGNRPNLPQYPSFLI